MALKNVGLPFKKKGGGGMPPPDFGPKRKDVAVETATVSKVEPVPGGAAIKPVAKAVKVSAPPPRGTPYPDVDEPPPSFGRGDPLGGGPPTGEAIPPEAVCYRSAAEVCGNCEYNERSQCSKLQIPVEDNDSCNLFSDRGGEDEEEGMPLTDELSEELPV